MEVVKLSMIARGGRGREEKREVQRTFRHVDQFCVIFPQLSHAIIHVLRCTEGPTLKGALMSPEASG